jgi:hypothetical protein
LRGRFGFADQTEQQHLFSLAGMNIARCFQDDKGIWYFTSREILFYLDPKTGKPVDEWLNP